MKAMITKNLLFKQDPRFSGQKPLSKSRNPKSCASHCWVLISCTIFLRQIIRPTKNKPFEGSCMNGGKLFTGRCRRAGLELTL